MGKNSKQEFDKKYWENFYDSDSNFKILCGNTAAFVQAWPRNQANFSKHIKTEPNHFKFLYIKISQITQNLAQNIGQTKIICNMKFISSLFFFLKNGLKYKTQFFLFSELPSPWTWLGAGMIFASSYYVLYKESTNKKAANDEEGTLGPV